MLNAKEIAAMYSEYQSLKWLAERFEERNRNNQVSFKIGALSCGGAGGVWHRNSSKYIQEQSDQAVITAINASIALLEKEFADLGLEIEPAE